MVSESLILDALAPTGKNRLASQVEWKISDSLVAYPEAVTEMEARVASIAEGKAGEQVGATGLRQVPQRIKAAPQPEAASS